MDIFDKVKEIREAGIEQVPGRSVAQGKAWRAQDGTEMTTDQAHEHARKQRHVSAPEKEPEPIAEDSGAPQEEPKRRRRRRE